ncbi:hypothetical protein ACN38_g1323 [Penicillium nordicum]|uniref:Uncharacterized protein n=1 Tax=Penicillium nordicum TaxID=229535 RepID=A0A0M9WJY1_9EURO|nr:hypothetical protein ACN38_g1323 [Penicillium nordicum]
MKSSVHLATLGVDLSIAHKWAQCPGPQPNPQWAMGLVFKAQPNPQLIGKPIKAYQKPIRYEEIYNYIGSILLQPAPGLASYKLGQKTTISEHYAQIDQAPIYVNSA